MIPVLMDLNGRLGKKMIRVDGYYLYKVSTQIHPLHGLQWFDEASSYGEVKYSLIIAEGALEPLLTRTVFQLRTSVQHGAILLEKIRELLKKIDAANDPSKTVTFQDLNPLQSALSEFEAVLAAELALIPLYVVTPKGGLDIGLLIEDGAAFFPQDIWQKVPEAIPDLQQGTRCIAYELPTAAGFHLHRANEAVLRRYWDAVTKGAPRPTNRSMGDYLAGLDNLKAGDPKVKAALRVLKDLHRNPLMHPEESLETVDDAIALKNAIHTVIVHMLKEIPFVATPAIGAATSPLEAFRMGEEMSGKNPTKPAQ
jgi:hypothetical protein